MLEKVHRSYARKYLTKDINHQTKVINFFLSLIRNDQFSLNSVGNGNSFTQLYIFSVGWKYTFCVFIKNYRFLHDILRDHTDIDLPFSFCCSTCIIFGVTFGQISRCFHIHSTYILLYVLACCTICTFGN